MKTEQVTDLTGTYWIATIRLLCGHVLLAEGETRRQAALEASAMAWDRLMLEEIACDNAEIH